MSIKITIPNTSSDVLTFGSANTPTAAQIAGIDSGSSNGQLALYTTASGTSTEAMRITAAQNVGIGVTNPSYKLQLPATAGTTVFFGGNLNIGVGAAFVSGQTDVFTSGTNPLGMGTGGSASYQFYTNSTERARIDSSGNLLVGTTGISGINGKLAIYQSSNVDWAQVVQLANAGVGSLYTNTSGTASYTPISFRNNGTSFSLCGAITVSGTTTAYATSSDYRLKENIAPMTGALAKVAQLNPVTYTWKSTNEVGEGFIAHELQAVMPDAVVGEKDAVDAEGNPIHQGIDTSFLVATLTAAIQEQQALITQLQADVAALKGA